MEEGFGGVVIKGMVVRIGLITTIGRNIGDDLIRRGIQLLLEEILGEGKVNFSLIDKEWPSIFMHALGLNKGGQSLGFLLGESINTLLGEFWRDRFNGFDLIVNCGAPLLWPACHSNVWPKVLWRKVIRQIYRKTPVLNMAIGSCYPWESQPSFISDPGEAEFLSSVVRYCRLTTVRDFLAWKLFLSLGIEVPFIPCTAFLSAKGKEKESAENIIIVNYMHGAGHYDWGQGIDASKWFGVVKLLVSRLKSRHKVVFLCHNRIEFENALRIDPSLPRVWPKRVEEYFEIIPRAKAALCNRMHASIALAGLGIPSVAVGTDTRMLMIRALGLPTIYAKEAEVDLLEDMLENQVKLYHQERERLLILRDEVWCRYFQVVSEVLV
ncbi:MAG: polysaccharide pyruvyl transferase family protein [Synergistetes bacterium]|nr:polysaccharide pyruvyl transferase family protein [Synergistota bacterium]